MTPRARANGTPRPTPRPAPIAILSWLLDVGEGAEVAVVEATGELAAELDRPELTDDGADVASTPMIVTVVGYPNSRQESQMRTRN